MNCTKCGRESLIIMDLQQCSGCVKPFNECACEPAPRTGSAQGQAGFIPPTSVSPPDRTPLISGFT